VLELPAFPDRVPSGRRSLAGRFRGIGENIAWGECERGTPREMVRSWVRSPGHRRNILDGAHKHIGVGVGWGPHSNSGAATATYTTDLGYKR
jgi:uncharacterized protein YkwD